MTDGSNPLGKSAPEPKYVAKRRTCLRCKIVFDSEWSGERICRRCKNSTSWRNGLPVGMRSVGH
jgi:hypothetical protein